MAWLMPWMTRAVPYLGYIVVYARKPPLSVDQRSWMTEDQRLTGFTDT